MALGKERVLTDVNKTDLRELVLPTLLLPALKAATLLIMYLKPVRAWFDQRMERISGLYSYGKNQNALVLVDTYRKRAMVDVLLESVRNLFYPTAKSLC